MPTTTTTNSASTTAKGQNATRSAPRTDRLSAAFFGLLRTALGDTPGELAELNTEEWKGLYNLAARQSLLGIVFYTLNRAYPDAEKIIPKQVYLKWYYQAQGVQALNRKHYELSRRLTEMFAEKGFRTVILKGQGNSRLYPDKLIRQTGDVDIWVEGGREKVLTLLSQMNLLEGAKFLAHDVTLANRMFDAEVEIHFDYMKDSYNPFANRRLRRVLDRELGNAQAVGEGFNVPPFTFSLLMQLEHIRKHLLLYGVGFRQVVDYFVLLRASSGDERAAVAASLGRAGLGRIAGALMWVLTECLGLEPGYCLCAPDARRGRLLLKELFGDGNFGKFSERRRGPVFLWWIKNRLRLVRMLPFDFPEASWYLLRYWCAFAFEMPERIGAFFRYKRHK